MATLNPPNSLLDVSRDTDFSQTITASSNLGETIISVTATLDEEDSGIVITPGATSVTLSGKHTIGFSDFAKYITKGSSDKIEDPSEINKLSEIPENVDLFEYAPSPIGSLTKNINVLVTTTLGVFEYPLTQEVNNNVEEFTRYIHNYYSEARGGENGEIQPIAVIEWLNNNEQAVQWRNNINQTIIWTQ